MSARGAGCWSHHCTLDSDCLLWSTMGCVAKTAASCPGVCAGTSLDLSGRSCLTGKEIPNTPDVTTCSNAECVILALTKKGMPIMVLQTASSAKPKVIEVRLPCTIYGREYVMHAEMLGPHICPLILPMTRGSNSCSSKSKKRATRSGRTL